MEAMYKNKTLSEDPLEKVADRWAQEPDDAINWATIPYVNKRTLEMIGGDPNKHGGGWDYMLDLYTDKGRPFERVLSLCCGHGHAERTLARFREFRHCDAYDISLPALEHARALAQAEGLNNINYEQRDLNNLKLSHTYDLVIGGGIHHISNLEGLFSEVSRCLAPNGVFLMYEYIGPAQCQPTERQVEAINACIHLLPKKYRVRISAQRELAKSPEEVLALLEARKAALLEGEAGHPGEMLNSNVGATDDGQKPRSLNIPAVSLAHLLYLLRASLIALREGAFKHRLKGYLLSILQDPTYPLERYFWNSFVPVTREQWNERDPSEAVRSDEIIPLLNEYFDEVDVRYTGGSILQFTLYDLAANFYEETEETKAILDMLFHIEDVLVKYDDIPQDYAVIVARNR